MKKIKPIKVKIAIDKGEAAGLIVQLYNFREDKTHIEGMLEDEEIRKVWKRLIGRI